MNEKGNTTFMGLVFLMLFCFIGLNLVSKRVNQIKEQKDKQELFLCTKKINGLTQTFLKNIHKTNSYLKVLTIGKLISITIPIPGINLATKGGIANAIKIIKILQVKESISYLNYMRNIWLKGCKISPNAIKTPFKFYGLGFKRDKLNQAKLRGKKWKIKVQKGKFLISNIYNSVSGKTRSEMKRASLFSILL